MMLLAGVTGGIGTGKSTLAALLAERGAQIIDADVLAREALKPSGSAWHSVVDQFGDEILAAHSMEVDRKRLAEIVFNDPQKLSALNAIVHPVVFAGIADRLESLSHTDEIVILDAALILETGFDRHLDALIVVVSDDETRTDRLRRDRGMTLEQVQARVRSQVAAEKAAGRADIVVRNDGTLEDLAEEADRVWARLEALRESKN
ncbi:MAG: dephospho-CoA kinase [Actinomycetota bacterium]|nr:dephospho-CoA kinase [Actinomycetota bacterium]